MSENGSGTAEKVEKATLNTGGIVAPASTAPTVTPPREQEQWALSGFARNTRTPRWWNNR